MSVTIRIKRKPLFGKKLNIEDIIDLSGLSYGVCDENFRLMPNKTAEHTCFMTKTGLQEE